MACFRGMGSLVNGMRANERNGFWNPEKPINNGLFNPLHDRGECYKVAVITALVTWALAIGSFFGIHIPPFLAGEWPWWEWVIIIVVVPPLSALLCLLFFGWMAVMNDFTGYLEQDTWRAAEKLRPEKPGPVVRWLHIAQVLVFLPLILAILGGANRYYE